VGACEQEKPRVKLIRNIRTSEKAGNTWIFLEPTVLEAAGFEVGDGVRLTIEKDALIFTKTDDKTHIISKRKRPGWKRARPLMDKTNREISAVIRAREKIDILVSDGMLVIRHSRSFDLAYIRTPMLMGADQKQIRTLSVPGGAGIGMACLADTGFFSSVGSLDIWAEAIDAYRHNFRNSLALFTDLRNIHNAYIPECDLVFLSPECVEFSMLGTRKEDIATALSPHYARIVYASGADYVLIEQVVPYYKSRAFEQLDSLLRIKFPYSTGPVMLDAYDMGSVAGRRRGYCVYSTRPLDDFKMPAPPKIPEHRRPTLKQVLSGFDVEKGDWKPIEGTVMEGLLKKNGNNNFRAESNYTLVTLDSKRISAFVTSYRKVQVTSSYLTHPENPRMWRMFEPHEIARIMGVPDWFQWDDEITSDATKTKLLGQSVDGNVIRAIGVELAVYIMGNWLRNQLNTPKFIEENGQLSLF
jgi:site-specific DNA-cytosine methylase